MLTVEVRSVRISGSFLALVLAMALLGPAPAAVIGVEQRARRRDASRAPVWDRALTNVVVYAIFPLVGGAAGPARCRPT